MLGMFRSLPILDNVIDYDGNISSNPDNEKFTSFEVGGEYGSDLVAIKGSFYNTQWKDRNLLSLLLQDKVTQVILTSFILQV